MTLAPSHRFDGDTVIRGALDVSDRILLNGADVSLRSIDVTAYASGDGVTDDTVALTTAFRVAATSGFQVVAPPGRIFLVSSTLTVSSAVRVDFNGSTIRKAASLTSFALNVTNAGCDIRNVVVDGNRSGGATGGGVQFAASGTLSDSTVSHCADSGVQVTGAGTELDAYRVAANDNVRGATNADGFYCSTSAVIRLYDCSAYGNDRQGVFIDSTAGDGCRVSGRFNANKRAGVSIRSDNGFMPYAWCDDNRQYGVELARDPIGWVFGVIHVSNTGVNLSGLWTSNSAGTGVELFGATYCRFDSVIARSNLGYGVAITTDSTTTTKSKYNAFASIVVAHSGSDRDPAVHFSEGAAHNSVGYVFASGSTVGVILGEDGVATTNDYNTIGILVAELCDFQALRINKGSFNYVGRIIARNCSTTDAVFKGVVDFSGANTISNVVGFVDQVDDAGPATTLPVNVVRFDASATFNRVLDGYGRSSSGAVAVDLNGSNEVAMRSLVAHDSRPTMMLASSARVRSTFDRRSAFTGAAVTLATGVMNSFAVELYAGDVVTTIAFRSGSTGATSPTNWWFALYDDASTPLLLGQTADQTSTAWGANTVMPKALAVAQTIPRTGVYYVSVMVAAATPPILTGLALQSTTLANGFTAGQKALCVTSGSALTTTAPASITSASTISTMAYAELAA